jgi:hypothetical protein
MSHSRQLDSILSGLAKDHATGSLRVGRTGTVYLAGGRVSYVESARTPGVEEILTASGRIGASGIRGVRRSAAGHADGGEALVRQGVLTRGELQFCVLGATLDASFFVLAATGTRPRFKEGDRHWLGDQWYFDVAGLLRECRRRRVQLDHVWPSSHQDSQPVVLAPRVTAHRVVLTAVQWEIVLNADATAAPAELARRIGRPVYAVLLAVRQLGAAGLLLRPEATPALPTRAGRAGRTGPRPGPALSEPAPAPGAGSPLPQVSVSPTDVSVLVRLRDALERL